MVRKVSYIDKASVRPFGDLKIIFFKGLEALV
jgi:hypothetical protein